MDSSTALAVFASCVQSMVQLTVITLSGAVLTERKIFTEQTNSTVAVACANFFFPIFISVNLGQSLSLEKLKEEWALFLSPFVNVALSSLVGLLLSLISSPPKHLRFSMLCLMCLNNSGNVPLLILNGACRSYGPLGGDSHCKDSTGYITLQVFNFNLLAWTYGVFLFQLDQHYRSSSLIPKDTDSPPPESRMRIFLKNLISPVPLGSYLGLITGVIPAMHWFMFDDDAPLRCLADALELIGMVGIVISQMILGSNLVLMHGRPSNLSRMYTVTSLITRLIVIPAMALGLTKVYQRVGIASDDRVQLYVLFLGLASPTAVSTLVLAQLTNTGINEVTKLVFLQYVFAVVTLTLSSYCFFLLF